MRLKLLLAACAIGIAAPAHAQDGAEGPPQPWRTGSGGLISRAPHVCGTKLGTIEATLEGRDQWLDVTLAAADDGRTMLLLWGDGLDRDDGAPRENFFLTFMKQNGDEPDDSQTHNVRLKRSKDGMTWITLNAEQLGQLTSNDRIEFMLSDGPGEFTLDHSVDADHLKALKRCVVEVQRIDPGSGRPAVTPARLLTPIGTIIGTDDYPLNAARGRIGGRVKYKLTISAKGLVTDCVSTTSVADDWGLGLDSCSVISERIRFDPARDAAGAATQGSYEFSMTWQPGE